MRFFYYKEGKKTKAVIKKKKGDFYVILKYSLWEIIS